MNRCLSHSLVPLLLLWFFLAAGPASGDSLETSYFLVFYPPSDLQLAQTVAGTMETARKTLTQELGVSQERQLTIRILPRLGSRGHARYLPDQGIIEVLTREAMAGSLHGRNPPLRFVKGILWHEYVHFLQHRAMKRFIRSQDALWFVEGTATYLGTQRFMRTYSPEEVWKEGKGILSGGRLPTLEDLNQYHQTRRYPLTAYFFSAEAVAFLIHRWGMEPLRQITKGMGEGKELGECFSENLGIDLEAFEGQWHDHLRKRYRAYIRKS